MYVGTGGVECAMSWSQCSLLSTGHSAREFLWVEWESITLCPHICPLKTTVIICKKKVRQLSCGCLNIVKVLFVKLLSSKICSFFQIVTFSVCYSCRILSYLLYLMSTLFSHDVDKVSNSASSRPCLLYTLAHSNSTSPVLCLSLDTKPCTIHEDKAERSLSEASV